VRTQSQQPIGLEEAKLRVARLEAAIRAVDAELRQQRCDHLEQRRQQLEDQHSVLFEAVENVRRLRKMPKCQGCCKIPHPTREEAERQLAMLRRVSDDKHDRELMVYQCNYAGSWHVGHEPAWLLGKEGKK
jgi:hypothetical protein